MNNFLIILLGIFLFFPTNNYAALQYRSEAEILPVNSEAIEFQYQTFSKTSSYDEQGIELTQANGENFSTNDWTFKYSRGVYPKLEVSLLANYRSVKSEFNESSATNAGLESIGLEGKYLFLADKKFKNAFRLHFKKATYKNNLYDASNPPPSDVVARGDDGQEYGVDYFLTYNHDKSWKYDFKFGYNKPSSTLSSELVYNAEAVYSFTKFFLVSGLGGIYSLKNDPYAESPLLKPIISNGNTRLFNSINREKKYLYAGVQYAIGDYIIGVKGETVFSGRSTDKGNTISLNIRWEKNEIPSPSQIVEAQLNIKQDYFAEGFVEKISKSGNLLKINIGTDDQVMKGSSIDIFNINDYGKGRQMATGTVIETGPKWSIVRINKRFNQSPFQVGYLVKAHSI